MSAALTLPAGVRLCHLPSPFRLAGGETLAGAVVAYELDGPADAPVVVVLGGISADRVARRWWPGVVGTGAAVDSERFRVLSIDWLGGAGCSTAPAAGEAFPAISTRDQALAVAAVLDELGVARVRALIGASYGGMVAQQLALLAPRRIERLVVLAAAERSHSQASAWRWLQREIVALGSAAGHGEAALALARGLAMTTYRSPGELAARFEDPAELHGWLAARGRAFAERFIPEQFTCLNASIDAHAVDAAAIDVPTTAVAFTSDQLVPPADVRRFADALPRLLRCVEIATPFGHDGFLKETVAVSAVLAEVLS
ncbi:MAG: homoserine O-succinyltransferase [Planctomycetes bacterium]|nr:homoserine O-succinyltransferase [Planctomycetota bacterium]